MSTDRDTTRIVRSWLEEGATALPDRVLDAVLDQLPATRQRRLALPVWRSTNMNTYAKLAIAAAAVVVFAVAGFTFLPRNSLTGPPATSMPSPTASASSSPNALGPSGDIRPATLGLLAAGRYSTLFDPPLTMTVPDGWSLGRNDATEVSLYPAAFGQGGHAIVVCRDTRAVDATNHVLPEIGTDARSIVDYLATRSDLRNVTRLSGPATIGGLSGWAIDFDGPPIPSGAPFGEVAVVGGPSCGINAYDQTVMRLGVFDLRGGGNVLIFIYSVSGEETIIEVGMPIVESFRFDAS